MTDTSAGTPPGKPAGRPRGKQLAILLGGGLLMALGGCAIFLANLNINGGGNDMPSTIGAVIFVVGDLMIIIGLIVAIMVGIQRSRDRNRQKAG